MTVLLPLSEQPTKAIWCLSIVVGVWIIWLGCCRSIYYLTSLCDLPLIQLRGEDLLIFWFWVPMTYSLLLIIHPIWNIGISHVISFTKALIRDLWYNKGVPCLVNNLMQILIAFILLKQSIRNSFIRTPIQEFIWHISMSRWFCIQDWDLCTWELWFGCIKILLPAASWWT